jgi:DNA-binding response OmpR family regulator
MSKTVLLVDYDPKSIDAIRRSLASVGLRIVLATDGEAGEREFHRVRPDLTLIQDVIPKKLGIELCRDLKDSPSGAGRAVVLLVFVKNGGKHRVLSSRCDDWIEKPFDEPTLLSTVRKFLPGLAPFTVSEP